MESHIKQVLRLGVAQIACVEDIEANLARHLEAIAEARRRGIDVLVFPELSLCDYSSVPDLPAMARPVDCRELRALAEAGRGLAALAGFIERAPDGRFYNSLALIAGGSVRLCHRKLNLPSYGRLQEGRHFAAGRALDLLEPAIGWHSAALICADAWNPALPWLAAIKGASLMLIPAASSLGAVADDFDNPAGWDLTLRQIAMTYGMPLAMANHCGRRGGLDFWGGSRILDAEGRLAAEAGAAPALIHADLDMAAIEAARERLPTVRDAAPRLIHALLAEALQETRGLRCR